MDKRMIVICDLYNYHAAIYNEHAKAWGVRSEGLYKIADPSIIHFHIESMNELLKGMQKITDAIRSGRYFEEVM
jgi:hypothetical protein